VPSLPAGDDVLQPALATKVCASPHSLTCTVGKLFFTLLDVCCVSYGLLTSSLQWLSVLDSCAQGRFKLFCHAAWIAFTPRSPEGIRRFLSHLGRSWNSISYTVLILWAMAGCFALCHQTVEWQRGGRKCLRLNSRHFPNSCSQG
jgi:hypothetical protein